jgi:5'-nucleotidase
MTLKIAVSARALFDLDEANKLFLEQGPDAFIANMNEHREEPFAPGVAFPLIKGVLNLNTLARTEQPLVEVLIITSFSPAAGVRILRSLSHHGLPILPASFITGNIPVVDYLEAFEVDLLLSKSKEDVEQAVDRGIAGALMYNPPRFDDLANDPQIRIAFDGDAVIFDEASEKVYQRSRLTGFLEHEKQKVDIPLSDGPFAKVLRTINELQKHTINGVKPFRIALMTARGGEARERVLRTFDAWGIHPDEAHFLSGFKKAGVLKAFRPHIFFDDQDAHVGPASEVVPAGLVPWKSSPKDGDRGTDGQHKVNVEMGF